MGGGAGLGGGGAGGASTGRSVVLPVAEPPDDCKPFGTAGVNAFANTAAARPSATPAAQAASPAQDRGSPDA